jgi:hypothetical protein
MLCCFEIINFLKNNMAPFNPEVPQGSETPPQPEVNPTPGIVPEAGEEKVSENKTVEADKSPIKYDEPAGSEMKSEESEEAPAPETTVGDGTPEAPATDTEAKPTTWSKLMTMIGLGKEKKED